MNESNAQVAALVNGMQVAMQDFETGRLRIDRLAWELKSRIAAIRQFSDPSWAEELKGIWNQLEMVNAIFIDSGREVLTNDELKEVREILAEFGSAISAY
jgi:hypothetical protein